MSTPPLSPVPLSGLPPGVETGPLGQRFVAQLVDLVVPAVVAAVASSVTGSVGVTLLSVLLVLAWLVLVWWMVATKAASPGMRLMKLQLVGLRDGRPIGWSRFLVRELILGALTVTGLGLLLMLIFLVQQPRRQGWHDLVAGSVLIKERTLAPSPPRQGATSHEPVPGVDARSSSHPAVVPSPLASPTTPGLVGAVARTSTGPSVGSRPPAPTPDSVRQHPAAADGRRLAGGWLAVLDDGRHLEVTGLVLLGRNPQPGPGEDDLELVRIDDEGRTVSKTHLALGLDGEAVFVVDRGSTNGSIVTDTTGVSDRCTPGQVVWLTDGSIVSFGNHWLRIEHRSER